MPGVVRTNALSDTLRCFKVGVLKAIDLLTFLSPLIISHFPLSCSLIVQTHT